MFLHSIGSNDRRFKTLAFRDGMNIVLADKTDRSTVGDSRNGAGKTSFVRILRYVLGGSIDDALKAQELSEHVFWADLTLGGTGGDETRVERPVKPQTKLKVDGAAVTVDEWKQDLGGCFHLPSGVARPNVGQLFGQLVRTYFVDPLKVYSAESSWETGARIGFLLGFSPEILGKAGEIAALKRNRKALSTAINEGALPSVSLNEPELRAQLAQARKRQARLAENLRGFQIDDLYAQHQAEADRLSAAIRDLNDEALALEQRKRDLLDATRTEQLSAPQDAVDDLIQAMYQEVGLVLPGAVARRFDEVASFHASVIRNRRMFLESELATVTRRLDAIVAERTNLDGQRSAVMSILNQSMALETFRDAQRELTEVDALVADLDGRLQLAQSVNDTGLRLRSMKTAAEGSLRTEMAERAVPLDEAISLFTELGQEIYTDRGASLLVEATSEGVLKVVPKIDGDASTGILEVKTFLLDIVCLVMALKAGRAPRILVHDSFLFDSMDDRQMASCLNIGARLADAHGFQYIVTLNSDRLAAAETVAFDRRDYVVQPALTDFGENGGLFGFRFK
ncbi:MAG: DUF2326 domain-containing protein [Bifidobacteriaceae bacterium]|jgi:uncharacterized protein YydD (DUF2326 family)|nr:DUF2326 domain-containing protein [Bifidobacteriaceae bacterium]